MDDVWVVIVSSIFKRSTSVDHLEYGTNRYSKPIALASNDLRESRDVLVIGSSE